MTLSEGKPGLSIRLMEDDDLPFIMEIERACHQFPWSEGIFRDCLNAGYHCLAGEIDNRIVAFAVLLFGAGEAHLLNICVEPASRGQGFAKRLLEDLCSTVRRAGVGELFLEVRPSNKAALQLYGALGFNQIGRRPDYYDTSDGREDALIYALTLVADS